MALIRTLLDGFFLFLFSFFISPRHQPVLYFSCPALALSLPPARQDPEDPGSNGTPLHSKTRLQIFRCGPRLLCKTFFLYCGSQTVFAGVPTAPPPLPAPGTTVLNATLYMEK